MAMGDQDTGRIESDTSIFVLPHQFDETLDGCR